MSPIDDLLSKHCSNGVTFSMIGAVAEVRGGATPSKSVERY